jgi:DNA anti-recombination protein RmuC
MLGVIRHQGQDIKRIFQRLETMDESLNTLKQHLNQIDTKFDEHTTLLTQILARLPKAP